MSTTATIRHIGRTNILAISGGRILVDGETLILPVRYGYSVEVTYQEVPDLYSVRRMWKRGTSVKCRGEISHLYADQVGDAAYRASCFRDPWGAAA